MAATADGGPPSQERGPPVTPEEPDPQSIKTEEYASESIRIVDPAPDQIAQVDLIREDMRGHIARVLVWALVLFLGFALLSSWIHIMPENRAALFDVLQLIIGPMIGLVGAVIGFYFGEKKG